MNTSATNRSDEMCPVRGCAFKADGYVLDAGKRGGKQFVNREQFFRKWVEGYTERLRPKLRLGQFSKGVPNIQLEVGKACWGGDQATRMLAQGLRRSDESVIHVYDTTKSVIAKNRLSPDPSGDVVLLQAAWKQEHEPMIAPAFVVYADLIHAHDPRCQEVAEQWNRRSEVPWMAQSMLLPIYGTASWIPFSTE